MYVNIMLQDSKFVVTETMVAMTHDAVVSSNPLIVAVSSPEEILQLTTDTFMTYRKVYSSR